MEQWEALIEACPSPVDVRYVSKAIQTASVVLKGDLAQFEIEWVLQTLLHKPVSLLSVVSSKRADDAWLKVIGDAFKLLADVTDRHPEQMETHFEDVVERCLLGFDAQTRKQALHCLTSVARVSAAGATRVHRHIASLEESTTGRAPLAILIGTICEHHPETVENEFNKIWRIFLNLLDNTKNTDTVTSSLLFGVLGLLKHFGCELPTAELTAFYDKIVADYVRIQRCEEACLKILASHASLFRERIARDVRVRSYLWHTLAACAGTAHQAIKATTSVYQSMCACLHKEQLQRIAITELIPQTQSHRIQVKYTALRLLTHLKAHCGVNVDVDGQTDAHALEFELRQGNVTYDVAEASHRIQVKYTALRLLTHLKAHCGVNVDVDGQTDAHALEFELRQGNVTYDVAEAVAWCIEANLPGSEDLLQAAILFYSHLPASRRKHIVVHGILNAQHSIRTSAIVFLISESILTEVSLETHQPLWRDLLDSREADALVLERSRLAFQDFAGYVVFVLEEILEQGVESPPEKLTTLLQLTAQVLTHHTPETYTSDHCVVLLPLLTELLKLHPDAATVSAARCACTHVADPDAHLELLKEFYQVVRIDRCADEAQLCASCLALVEAPSGAASGDVLMALQIIFSRNDVEPQMLSKALLKLENIINLEKDYSNSNIFIDILHHVHKIRSRKDLTGKDARILHRDVLMFLGKYGGEPEINNNMAAYTTIVNLMDSLTLNVVNPDQGTTYKINLQKILHQALEHEEPDSLHMLLVILYANLWTRRDPAVQEALSLVCGALCRAQAHGARGAGPRALLAAGRASDSARCVHGALRCISEEKSPGVRKMLSDALEALLVSDREDALISSVAEHSSVLMRSDESTKKRAGLNITETLLSSLKEYNLIIKNLLPELLVAISNTFETDSETTFDAGSKLFMEKIELFNTDDVENLLRDLLEVILVQKSNMADVNKNKIAESEARIFKIITKKVLEFVKSVTDYKSEDIKKIWLMIFDILEKENCDFEKCLYVLAKFKNIFQYESGVEREFLNKLFSVEIQMEEPYFCMEAVLIFLQEYADLLLELYYQETIQFLRRCITELSPPCIKYLHRNIRACLSVYTNRRTPALQSSLEAWCSKLPLMEITNSIEKELFTTEHSIIVFALKVMLQFIDISTLTDVSNAVQKWPKILLKLFSNGYITSYLQSKLSYLTDLLAVSVKFLKVTDVKKLILEGSNLDGLPTEKIGLQFCRFFMHVFYAILVKKPFILLDADLNKCRMLLNDVVKFTVKKKCTDQQYDVVLELVDQLWPTYEREATFTQKYSLLLDVNSLPRKFSPDSKPLQWAVNNVIYSEASREDKARLIEVLPGGEEYSPAYRSFASLLPTRLSEMRGGALCSLRAPLRALAATRDRALLGIVTTLASGDESKGWWDEAIETCMASVAAGGDLALCKLAHTQCWRAATTAACRRVLLPLLRVPYPTGNNGTLLQIDSIFMAALKLAASADLRRYSTAAFVEEFFSTILGELLRPKEQKLASAHRSYHKSIVEHTKMFLLLQIACEKIPQTSLESPSSTLYKEMEPKVSQPWHLIRTTCRLCVRLRQKPLPEGADRKFKEDYRQFQCANYNCFAAAICRRRPNDANIYANLFVAEVWDALLDQDKEYSLRIRHQWNARSTRQAVSIVATGGGAGAGAGAGAGSLSVRARSRVFLRTLSESPLMFDLIEPPADEQLATTQDIELPANELNEHECAGTLTALLNHVAAWLPAGWCDQLAAGLRLCKRNTRWLLAQVICNCKEDLKAHASDLRAALLETVASTAIEVQGKKILNGLHVDILETVLEWGDDSPSPSAALDASLSLLLATGVHHKEHAATRATLVSLAVKVLERYGGVVSVPEDVYEPYLTDNDTPKTLLVHIPSVLPTLLARLEDKQLCQLPKVAEAFGLALNSCSDKQRYLIRFRKALDVVRQSNGAHFVRMLFYAQSGCRDCCDEYNFRMATNLAQKLVGEDKKKCLRILTAYVTTSSSEYIQEMFETVDLPELMSQESVEAFDLVRGGIGLMGDGLKRRLVMVAARYCDHSVGKVREAAAGVMLKAFEDLLKSPDEPASKRLKPSSSVVVSTILSSDVYAGGVMRALGGACAHDDDVIGGAVRAGAARLLSKDMATRFVECFLLTVYLPTTSDSKSRSLSVCVFALLDMLLLDLRSQDRFKRILLRDEPLEVRSASSAPSRLLTMSRTYQGSFRRTNFTSKRNSSHLPDTDSNGPDIDVQISIEHILDTFMRFAKEVPQASEVLCLEFVQAIKPGFDLGPEMGRASAAILDRGVNELTPFVAELCRIFVDDLCKVDGVQNIMKRLEGVTKNSEGEGTIRLLSQEVRLRSEGPEQFVLGSVEDEPHDVAMGDDAEFSIEGLTSVFGMLSNWDNLTLQQKSRVRSRGLPPLWTDRDTFRELLDTYTGSEGWFSKMAVARRGAADADAVRWLRGAARWPATHFHYSAVTEAVSWLSGRAEASCFPCDIRPQHCLAEWAARLMLRAAYQASLPDSDLCEERSVLSRSHELTWCKAANDRELGAAVLQCVKRNAPSLSLASEPLPWLCSQLRARRSLGGGRAGGGARAVEAARAHVAHAPPDAHARLHLLTLLLHRDEDSLSRENIQEVFEMIESGNTRCDLGANKRTLRSIYELAMSHYDDLWDTEATTGEQQSALVSEMTDVLARDSNLGSFDEDLLAVVLSRLDEVRGTLGEDVANKLLELVHSNLSSVDDFTVDYILSLSGTFPSRSLSVYPLRSASEDEALVKYRRCFELLCDPEHSLLQYCSELRNAVKTGDEDQYESAFRRMREKLFENPHAGTDYQLLNRYKSKLYEISEYDMSPVWRAAAERALRELGLALATRGALAHLSVTQLCPPLARLEDCPPRLLGLPERLKPLRIDSQVTLLSSARRPALLCAVLSDGSRRRYIVKSGEPLRADAAAQRAAAAAGRRGARHTGYKVTPLSEDCGLIEFLEDHETLRSLIGADVLDRAGALASAQQPADNELLLAPMPASLAQHRQMCEQVPSHLLRDALTRRAVCERDRLLKMRNFQDTLASATIITWILGVGDRHLENILCCTRDGRLCHVDWAAALRYGPEPPPARLTRNLLAVTDHSVLEARMQQLLASLRETHKQLSAVIKVSFKWMGEIFHQRFPYIKAVLRGGALSRDQADGALLELLGPVLEDFQVKEHYGVDEQISCLLRHCTAPRVLGVTRALWEPWV